MTREEKEKLIQHLKYNLEIGDDYFITDKDAVEIIKTLEQEPCEDAISRQAVLQGLASIAKAKAKSDVQKSLMGRIMFFVEQLPPVTPRLNTGRCKDCKWWKDSDGIYRRGGHAESQCPINRKEVLEGNGYCYMFEPQKSEDEE